MGIPGHILQYLTADTQELRDKKIEIMKQYEAGTLNLDATALAMLFPNGDADEQMETDIAKALDKAKEKKGGELSTEEAENVKKNCQSDREKISRTPRRK